MKRALLTSILFFAILLVSAQQPQRNPESENRTYKVMSFNIRMSGFSQSDGINAWSNRKEAVINMIHDVDANKTNVGTLQKEIQKLGYPAVVKNQTKQ